MTASTAEAACTPAAGAGTPVSGTIVTCSATTTNQNAPIGYGDGSQNGLTINVLGGASVIGTNGGFGLDGQTTANTINNSGTIRDDGSNPVTFNAISAIGSGGINLTNTASGSISGTSTNANAIVFAVNGGVVQGSNAGSMSVSGSGSETAVFNAINVTFTNTGTMSASGSTVNGTFGVLGLTSVSVTNSGTISANGGTGLTGTAIESFAGASTLNVTNKAGGLITGTEINTSGLSLGIFAGGTGNAVITNAGTIHGDDAAIASASNTTTTIVNTGTISGGGFGAIRFVGTGTSSVENAGIITLAAGNAILFAGGNNLLKLDPGSSITGNVVGTGTDNFQLGGTGAASFDVSTIGAAAQYRGFSTYSKVDTSTWTLTGTNPAVLPWTVNGGTLLVDGSIASSTMTVNAGGTLGGSGTVGSTIVAGGTLAPGSAGGSIFGPLKVAGNLSFTAASTYMIQVSPANAGRTNVTGTATLGGATVSAVFGSGAFVQRQYVIVNATGGVSGTFNPAVTSNQPNIQSTLSYDAKDAFLNIKVNFTTPGGLNTNQQNVANALTNFFSSNGGIPFAFATLTPAGLTQASGEVATGSQQTTFDAMGLFMGLLTDPFVAGRGDGTAGGTGATPFAEEGDASAYAAKDRQRSSSERDAYAAIYRKAPQMADPFTQRWSVWAAGYGGSQTTDGNATLGSNNTSSNVYGTAVGADYRFSPFTTAGFALAGGGTNFSIANNLGSGRSDLFQAGAFLRHTAGPAYVSAALAYGWQDVTTDRTLTIAGVDHLRAEFNANAFSGRVEGGYRFVAPWVGGVGITPYAAGQFTTFDLPAYAEAAVSGANTFALSYAAKDVTASRSELGLRSDKSYPMPNGILTLRGRAAWAHDFNADRNIAATFQTLPGASFVVNGAAQAHDAALTTASAEMKWINGWSAAATFEGEFSEVTRSYAGKGVVRYTW